jgi:hypothetical protein
MRRPTIKWSRPPKKIKQRKVKTLASTENRRVIGRRHRGVDLNAIMTRRPRAQQIIHPCNAALRTPWAPCSQSISSCVRRISITRACSFADLDVPRRRVGVRGNGALEGGIIMTEAEVLSRGRSSVKDAVRAINPVTAQEFFHTEAVLVKARKGGSIPIPDTAPVVEARAATS